MKKAIVKVAATIGKLAAVKSSHRISRYGYHQPKEPEALRRLK